MLKDDVSAHNFKTICGNHQVWQLLEGKLTKYGTSCILAISQYTIVLETISWSPILARNCETVNNTFTNATRFTILIDWFKPQVVDQYVAFGKFLLSTRLSIAIMILMSNDHITV